jgi:pimeloyl-ACP methyl ester carboxylesterase
MRSAPTVIPLPVEREGDGPVVLLLHGIGGGKALWDVRHSGATVALAAAGFTALAIDFPGYGDSSHEPAASIAGMAQAVFQTLDALGIDRAAVVGHSMGGMVAQEMAGLEPTRVTALVLACTSSAFGPPGGEWQAAFIRERIGALEASGSMAGMARRLVPTMLGSSAPDAAAIQALEVMSRVPEATYRRSVEALAGFDRRAALSQILAPALCLAASEDRTAPPEVLRRMALRLPRGEYAEIPGAGHLAPVEQSAAFHDLVVGFLRRHLC